METTTLLKSKTFKLLLPFVVILGLISIAKSGYIFGQWLYAAIH